MSFRRSFVFLVLTCGLMLTGFGCKKIEPRPANMIGGSANGKVVLPTVSVDTQQATTQKPIQRKPPRKPHAEVVRLREIMSNVQKSQSFKTNLSIGGIDGIKGQISYSQADGMYGKLSLKNGLTSEMAIKGQRVAVRNGTSTWQEVTGTPEAEQIAALFTSITNKGSNEPLYPSENARYESAKDDPRGCKLHSLQQYVGEMNSYQPLKICVERGLPVYFSIQTQDGLIQVEYIDIDKPVTVFFPIS